MKLLTSFLALSLLSFVVWAQAPTGKISGVVLDSATNKGVEFVTVTLLDATKKTINGSACDDAGKFVLTGIPVGSYTLSITFVGYNSKLINVQISNDKNELDLGNIIFSPSTTMLKNVEVTEKKPLVEEKIDRLIYNAESDPMAHSGNATDILRHVPLVSVDMNGNPSVRGKQSIKVLINGKPSTLMAGNIAEALKQIPANQIKSVEVITSPSAKYDAEGSGGIINIVLKKNDLEGAILNLNTSAEYRGSGLGIDGTYKKEKLAVSLNGYGGARYNSPGKFYNDQTTITAAGEQKNIQFASSRNESLYGDYTFGLDYDFDKSNSINSSVRFGTHSGHSYQDGLTTQSFINGSRNPAGESTKFTNSLDQSNSVDASINYTHLFAKKNEEFSILTLYSQSNHQDNFVTHTTQQPSPGTTPNYIKNINPTFNSEATLQADYQTPLTEKQLLEVGGKTILRTATSNYNYYQATADGNYSPYVGSFYTSNLLNYTQNITGWYASYTLDMRKKYSLKAGARYEYTSISANNDAGSVPIPSYGILVPNLTLAKKFANGNMLKISYNRRIQRPSIHNLNPNVAASNSLSMTTGNPTLTPEYTNNYALGYSVYIKKTSIISSLFASTSANSIQQIRSTDPNNPAAVLTSYANIGIQNVYGFNIYSNISLLNKFTLSVGTNGYYVYFKNPGTSPTDPMTASNGGWVYNGHLMASYNNSKGWGVHFLEYYQGTQATLQGYQTAFKMHSLSVQKEFNNKRGSIGLGIENFLTPTLKMSSQSISPVVNQTGYSIVYNFNFEVTCNYRIGKLTVDQSKKKRSVVNDDLKSSSN